MTGRNALAGCLSAAALLVGAPGPAPAQCRLCETPTTAADPANSEAAILLEVEASLDFDRLVLLGGGQGAATLLPSGERSATGTLAPLGARAMVGSVTVRGEPGRSLRVEIPKRVVLHSLSGGQVVIDDIETDLPSLPRLDSAGRLSFRFGGRLSVSGDSEGDYRGDVPITVDYL